jgi:nitrite reductase/ring-hydroxylating ferredoxin subunit
VCEVFANEFVPYERTLFFHWKRGYHLRLVIVNWRLFMSGACRFLSLCKAAEVAEGKAIKVEKEGLTLAVFNIDGEYFVTDDTCTHGPGSLSEGPIDGEVVECDFHNGAFNIKTGAVVAAPCMIPLKTYKARLQGDEIEIET